MVLSSLVVTQSPYLFVDTLAGPGPQRYYRVMAFNATNAPNSPTNMALIPAGTFEMGDTFSEGATYELPVHQVYVSAFYMDKYEVTKALWDQVIAWQGGNGYTYDNPGSGKAPNHPFQSIDWYDMVKWCNARSEREGRVPAYYTDAALTQVYKTGQAAPFVNGTPVTDFPPKPSGRRPTVAEPADIAFRGRMSTPSAIVRPIISAIAATLTMSARPAVIIPPSMTA